MIVIVDYGMGNLGSIKNMLKKTGNPAVISNQPAEINQAEKLILPGVGAFDKSMENLKNLGLLEVLNRKVLEEKTPILGICLGMQIMTKKSEEGQLPGLGWIDAEIKRFKFDGPLSHLKIPHMGWNTLAIKKEHPLMTGLYSENRFYFVHSYYLSPGNDGIVLAESVHGNRFVSAVAAGNILGVQFHPEKSHKFGMTLLSNYIAIRAPFSGQLKS